MKLRDSDVVSLLHLGQFVNVVMQLIWVEVVTKDVIVVVIVGRELFCLLFVDSLQVKGSTCDQEWFVDDVGDCVIGVKDKGWDERRHCLLWLPLVCLLCSPIRQMVVYMLVLLCQ